MSADYQSTDDVSHQEILKKLGI